LFTFWQSELIGEFSGFVLKGEGNRLTLEGTLRSYLKSSNSHGLKPQKKLSKKYRDNLKEH
jgi:hypothetical protein